LRTWLSALLVIGLIAGCASGAGTMPPSAAPSSTPGALPSASDPPSDPPTPTRSASLAPGTFPTPAVTAAPTPSVPAALHGWVERASFPGESLDVLVLGGPGLIAAGSRASTGDAGPGAALIRLSADGSTWRTAVVEGSSGGSIHSIRQVDGTYVALGTRQLGEADFRGAAWTSPDAERWVLVATFPMLVPRDFVERDGQLLAWGTGGWTEPYGLFVWTLDDVGRWSAARQIDAPEEAFLAEGIIKTSRGYLAFGNRGGVIPAAAARAFVATSVDGATWRFAQDQPSLERAAFKALVERRDGYLAVGWALTKDGSPAPAVWRSADGMTWERTLDPAASTTGWLARAAISDDRLLVRGASDGSQTWRAVSWESLDGIHWTLLALGADIPDVTGTMPSDPVTLARERFAVATLHDATLRDSSSTRAIVLVQGTVPR
jgi:hypothetical protein